MPLFERQGSRFRHGHLVSPARPDRAMSRVAHAEGHRHMAREQALGNHAMQRMLRTGTIRARLTINQPGDRYEQEADRVAERVMRMPDPAAPVVRPSGEPPAVQRLCTECEEQLHRKEASGAEVVGSDFQHPRDGGRPLPDTDQGFFEPRFGRDFSQVRVHTGPAAGEAARSVGALAYTMGSDVVFGEGQYRPGTEGGRKLLAHELAHVIQQGQKGAASTPSLQRQQPADPGPALTDCPIATRPPVFGGTDLVFPVGSPTLTPTAAANIRSFVARWNAAGAAVEYVRVDGYGPSYQLSCDRARMVKKELASGTRGIPSWFIEIFAQPADVTAPASGQVRISADLPLVPGGMSCPFFRGYDRSKPLESYNCSGLAFRTYGKHNLDDTKEILQTRGSKVNCGTPCDRVGMIKFWLWEYDVREEDSSGRVLIQWGRSFHTVAGPTAGDPSPKDSDEFYSKNSERPVYGPSTALRFKPPARERATSDDPAETPAVDPQGNPAYWVRWNLKESCYCFPCPKDLNDADW